MDSCCLSRSPSCGLTHSQLLDHPVKMEHGGGRFLAEEVRDWWGHRTRSLPRDFALSPPSIIVSWHAPANEGAKDPHDVHRSISQVDAGICQLGGLDRRVKIVTGTDLNTQLSSNGYNVGQLLRVKDARTPGRATTCSCRACDCASAKLFTAGSLGLLYCDVPDQAHYGNSQNIKVP